MANNANNLVNYLDIDSNRKGTGSSQLPGGWTKHAPSGGITIGGKYFKGGQFIPEADLESASPEELDMLNRAIAKGKSDGNKLQGINPDQKFSVETGKPTKIDSDNEQEVKETIFVVADGSLLGIDNLKEYGDVVLKNNPHPDFIILEADLRFLNSYKTKRFDVINAHTGEVISLESSEGHWPSFSSKLTSIIFDKLLHVDHIKITHTKLVAYSPIGNLNKVLQKLFLTVNKTQNMSLKKINKNTYVSSNKIVKMCLNKEDARQRVIAHNLWKLLGIKTGNMESTTYKGKPAILSDPNVVNVGEKNIIADSLLGNISNKVFSDKVDLKNNIPTDVLTQFTPYKEFYDLTKVPSQLEDIKSKLTIENLKPILEEYLIEVLMKRFEELMERKWK